ncbi:MAG TPA: hypothetical protein VMO26_09000 [Vicinamibacterales bacterium]|nr:hypothetical protein [Vicinamibacterales bacterium]
MTAAKKAPRERPVYSQRWLAAYGRTLQREDVQLVQASRALTAPQRADLLRVVRALVIDSHMAGRQ